MLQFILTGLAVVGVSKAVKAWKSAVKESQQFDAVFHREKDWVKAYEAANEAREGQSLGDPHVFVEELNDNLADPQLRKAFFEYVRYSCITLWLDRAEHEDFGGLPTENIPLADPTAWKDLPQFLDEAFLPRLSSDSLEMAWFLRLKDRFPGCPSSRAEFAMSSLGIHLSVIGTLEHISGQKISSIVGTNPDPFSKEYQDAKKIVHSEVPLFKSVKEMYSYFFGEDYLAPFRAIDVNMRKKYSWIVLDS